ncbi:cathepsin B-like [Pectinophora gossypiella]|uniref:cathepsin B-like n=1 Tax=Pectinophora gossypiella TaxID=13191 RepID=UPI00214EB588|nr:cathepsin B-like [Pectinophora gossypiella]
MLRLLVLVASVTFVACDFDQDLHNKYLSMGEDEFVEYFNSRNFSYKIKNYDFTPSFGAMNYSIPKGIPVITYNESSVVGLPENFDSREKWPNCVTIGEIYDQGNDCGSCWTFGTSNTASDRTCIHKGVTVRLSQQDFNCNSDNVCGGGSPQSGFQYYINEGLVTQECKPYNVEFLKKRQCDRQCANGASYAADKHKGSSFSAVDSQEETIKAELFNNGPIETMFNAYEDLRNYTSGVYVHKYGKFLALHSVRVIGYGVEDGTPYWLVANSWGQSWGLLQGFFKVKRYASDLDFEKSMLSVMP